MIYRVPRQLKLSPEGLAYLFAAFNGLAYYAFILTISPILPFEKGVIRFATSVIFLGLSVLLFLKNYSSSYRHQKKKWPLGVQFIIAYFIWSLMSFAWSDSEGFNTQGFGMPVFYFAQWTNYVIELTAILLLCMICPIQKLTINYLKGLRIGGVILASSYLFVWLFIEKGGRLSAFGQGVDVLHPNNLALKLAISLLCTIHLFSMNQTHKKSDWFSFLIPLTVMFFAMFLTVGKTVLVAFFIALCFYIANIPRNLKLKLTLFAFSVFMTMLGLPIILDYMTQYISYGGLDTLSGRTEIWAATWEESLKHPIIGHGIASPFPSLWWYLEGGRAGHSGTGHNDYLNAFYQMGFIGLFIVAMMYLLFLNSATTLAKKLEYSLDGVFAQTVFILMFVFSLTASFPVGFPVPVTFQAILHCWMSRKWRCLSDSGVDETQNIDSSSAIPKMQQQPAYSK